MAVLDRKEVLAIVESWPVDDRLSFVQEVCDRIPPEDSDPYLTEELKIELNRRLAAHDADPALSIPWEEVKAKALLRLSK